MQVVKTMLKLPKSTTVNKFLTKEKLADKLNLNTQLKDSLKNDVKKFTIGKTLSAVFVIEVLLKKQQFDYKLLETITKQNPNKIIFVINYENILKLAIFHGRL